MRIDLLQISGEAAKYLLISLAIVYALDWSVFEVKLARGAGMGSVPVEQYLATQLKGSKAEYDYQGTVDEKCSRTVFPQHAASNWDPPCWWLERHRVSWN